MSQICYYDLVNTVYLFCPFRVVRLRDEGIISFLQLANSSPDSIVCGYGVCARVFVVSAEQVYAHVYRCERAASGIILQETSQRFVWDPLIGLELH